MSGKVTYYHSNGNVYTYYAYGKRNGQGTYEWKEGDK